MAAVEARSGKGSASPLGVLRKLDFKQLWREDDDPRHTLPHTLCNYRIQVDKKGTLVCGDTVITNKEPKSRGC